MANPAATEAAAQLRSILTSIVGSMEDELQERVLQTLPDARVVLFNKLPSGEIHLRLLAGRAWESDDCPSLASLSAGQARQLRLARGCPRARTYVVTQLAGQGQVGVLFAAQICGEIAAAIRQRRNGAGV